LTIFGQFQATAQGKL